MRITASFDDLGIAHKTVSSHVEHILAKLGVGRRSEIAAWTAGRAVSPVQPVSPAPPAPPARR